MALNAMAEDAASFIAGDALAEDRARAKRDSLLHVFPNFDIGGVPLRMVRIINHFGGRFRHSIIALDGNFGAAERLAEGIDVRLIEPPPRRRGMLRSSLAGATALRKLRPDLVATYNWGAIEWAIASRLSGVARHIHFESGFGKEEADRQIRRRVLCRRWALAGCERVVVPSRKLEELARRVWKLPAGRVTYLPNGIDVERFAALDHDAVPGFARRPGELVVGTVAPLRPEKNIGRLIRAFAILSGRLAARLVVAGEGVERASLARLAAELGIADRVTFTGQVPPETVLGGFDVFALSSDTEQMPNALLEAMAASRAVAAVDVGDVKAMLGEENRQFIVPRDHPDGFAAAIERLLREPATRAQLGRKNREKAVADFSQERMFAAYSEILGGP
ncbi:MAG TPA: glycosyltransferase [Stellaceae bacterium]|nr:glycosyltransferase [Stellaceae bacterium]